MNHNKKKNVDDDVLSSSSKPHVLRIAHILLDQEEEPDLKEMEERRIKREQLMIVQYSTPHRIISRWFSALKRRGSGKQPKFRKQSIKTVKTYGNNDGGGGSAGKESFNLGVACGLLYVIAAGKNVLNKMVELRKQMELILDDAKNNTVDLECSNDIDNNNNLSSISTDFQQGPTSSSSGSQFSLQSVGVVADDDEVEERQETGMDQLEAELQTELERLELLHLEDSETDSISPHHQTIKDDDDDESSSSCCEVINDGGEGDMEFYNDELLWGCGVCPVELERKLHRVLVERQEARIKELELALAMCTAEASRERNGGLVAS